MAIEKPSTPSYALDQVATGPPDYPEGDDFVERARPCQGGPHESDRHDRGHPQEARIVNIEKAAPGFSVKRKVSTPGMMTRAHPGMRSPPTAW